MGWSIERDNAGRPVRMVWMGHGQDKRDPTERRKVVLGCSECGFHFGWHAKGCKHRASDQPAGDA